MQMLNEFILKVLFPLSKIPSLHSVRKSLDPLFLVAGGPADFSSCEKPKQSPKMKAPHRGTEESATPVLEAFLVQGAGHLVHRHTVR